MDILSNSELKLVINRPRITTHLKRRCLQNWFSKLQCKSLVRINEVPMVSDCVKFGDFEVVRSDGKFHGSIELRISNFNFKLVDSSYIYVTKFCKRISWRTGGLQFISVRSGSVSLDN